jgi:ribosomal protein S6--L-glutamate ligase
MILSYHPCFEADENRLCAGRLPDESDLALIRSADAVILPQGCSAALFRMARRHCPRFFPDYTARFAYPGKLGQARLFRKTGVPHPDTLIFDRYSDFRDISRDTDSRLFALPFVLKMDWGGEGDNVHLVASGEELDRCLDRVRACEATGQHGFLIQRYIPSGFRSLRVVVIYRKTLSYWRTHDEPGCFCASLSKGARMDRESDPALQDTAIRAVGDFCAKTGIDLAGFDILFSDEDPDPVPLFLEINYFFGRQGIGGSEAYYALLIEQIDKWLADRELSKK